MEKLFVTFNPRTYNFEFAETDFDFSMKMEGFRKENQFLVYLVNFSGLYLKSIERLTDRKWLLYFLSVWTKIAIALMPIYIGSVVKFLIFEKASFNLKMAVFRRVIAFSCFLLKNIYFYLYRGKIEGLIDLWDSFFKEDFYSENREEKLRINKRQNIQILSLSWILTATASLIYSVPPFFTRTKTLSHPSGIPYRQQSPDYELMVAFDFFRVVMGCLTAVSLDCVLMVFLSHVLVELTHLRDSLTKMVDAVSIDALGHVTYKSGRKKIKRGRKKNENSFYVQKNSCGRGVLKLNENDGLCKENLREFEEKMRIWILHHQQVIKFFECLKNLFAPIASLQLVYVVFYTCFTAFHLVRARHGIDIFVIPIVAASNLVSLFVWCYMGVQVDLMNSHMFGGAFGRCWFLFPLRIQRAFFFVVMRGWKPLVLRGLSMFDLNLFTFFQVFKITYQLFAFLLQVARED